MPHKVNSGRFKLIHGDSYTSEYNIWVAMKQRCSNPKATAYEDYGARGITVCARWQDYRNFIADMGRRPTPQHTLDRRDSDGPYTQDNCRWATRLEQNNNVRRNIYVVVSGKRMTLSQAARALGITYNTAYGRVANGKPLERA